MNTTTTDRRIVEIEHGSAWRSPRFRRLVVITLGTALLLSLAAITGLNADVKKVAEVQLPYIQNQLSLYQFGG